MTTRTCFRKALCRVLAGTRAWAARAWQALPFLWGVVRSIAWNGKRRFPTRRPDGRRRRSRGAPRQRRHRDVAKVIALFDDGLVEPRSGPARPAARAPSRICRDTIAAPTGLVVEQRVTLATSDGGVWRGRSSASTSAPSGACRESSFPFPTRCCAPRPTRKEAPATPRRPGPRAGENPAQRLLKAGPRGHRASSSRRERATLINAVLSPRRERSNRRGDFRPRQGRGGRLRPGASTRPMVETVISNARTAAEFRPAGRESFSVACPI